MSMGLIGQKEGMTRVFTPEGASMAVTVIRIAPNIVTQVKKAPKEQYAALQVTTGSSRVSRLTKAEKGHFAKAAVEAGRGLWEFDVKGDFLSDIAPGHQFTVDYFQPGQIVKVTGTTKGKGYAGTVKRHNFRTQDATHGNSVSHRAPGSIGQCQFPGRVLKGKKMSGHMGNVRRTIRGLEVVKVDAKNNLILVKGAVPGARGGNLRILPLTFPPVAIAESKEGAE